MNGINFHSKLQEKSAKNLNMKHNLTFVKRSKMSINAEPSDKFKTKTLIHFKWTQNILFYNKKRRSKIFDKKLSTNANPIGVCKMYLLRHLSMFNTICPRSLDTF